VRRRNRLSGMGNREALLAGAKRCLLEKGFARTTARDIAAASGVSLAAIGYHFGSKEALLTDALMQAIQEWEVEFRQALSRSTRPRATPTERFEAIWSYLIQSFAAHRAMWVANFDVFLQMDHVPEIRQRIGEALQGARVGLASLFLNVDEAAINARTAQTVGAFHHALMIGVMAQWLMEPKQAPSARDLTEALRAVTAQLQPNKKERNVKRRTGSRRQGESEAGR
jgi:AcrR family transcriptional regulator